MTISYAQLKRAALVWSLCAVTLAPVQAVAGDVIRAGGTGIGLALMKTIGEHFTAANPDAVIDVLPSLGSSGGIKAVAAKAIDIAIIANRLTPEQAALGLMEGACLKTAYVFATSYFQPMDINRARLSELYADPNPTWPDGQALKIILRARSGSENPYLIKVVPAMKDALDAAYARSGIPIGSTDQENADLAQRVAGSLSFMSMLQLRTEKLKLRTLTFEGVEPNMESLTAGTYPLPLDVCLLLRSQPSDAAARIIAYVRSSDGQQIMRGFDALPLE